MAVQRNHVRSDTTVTCKYTKKNASQKAFRYMLVRKNSNDGRKKTLILHIYDIISFYSYIHLN